MSHRVAQYFWITSFLFFANGCDWLQYHFLNSIPFHGDPTKNPVMHVYLGVDGLAYSAVQEAQARGAFQEKSWRLSALVNVFPATSDYSWTRMFKLDPIGGYEYSYFNPDKDKIENDGVTGLLNHVAPPVFQRYHDEATYLEGFDFRANGYTQGLNAYQRSYTSYAETLDQLFFILASRAQTTSSFSAYLIEIDVLGHIKRHEDVLRSVSLLSERIQEFVQNHPERRFVFTLFSDHGNDAIPSGSPEFIAIEDELPKLGVHPIKSLSGHDPKTSVAAVAVRHTRVTYIALHTHAEQIEEVARRTSVARFVDISVARTQIPAGAPCSKGQAGFGIWAQGKAVAVFSYDAVMRRYCLPTSIDVKKLDLPISFAGDETEKWITDEESFQLTQDKKYPDLFYRIRTALNPVGAKYPADVLLSLAPPYASRGIDIPGAELNGFGSHGALDRGGSLGALLSQERDLPFYVRADSLLEVVPGLKEHLLKRGLKINE